jgi:hypothetical protein
MTSLILWTDSVGLRNDLLGSGVLRWSSGVRGLILLRLLEPWSRFEIMTIE